MTHHTDAELLPCPFCGAAPKIEGQGAVRWIKCPEDSACGSGGMAIGIPADDLARGIASWNRRAPAAPVPISDELPQGFLSDVLTAAGLVRHGKQCKALADRLGDAVEKIRTASIAQREAIAAAPAAPVPQSEPVAYLWQHCETGRTRVVMPDMVITADANWIVVGPLYLAAAPQPPVTQVTPEMIEAAQEAYMPFGDMELAIQSALSAAPQPPACNPSMQPEHATYSASVQMPEPMAYVHTPALVWNGKIRPVVSFEKYEDDYKSGIYSLRTPLYSEQQVRDLLAAHGIGKGKQG